MATRLVRLAGSSAYFDRSIVAYSKEAKIQALGVDPAVLDRARAIMPRAWPVRWPKAYAVSAMPRWYWRKPV